MTQMPINISAFTAVVQMDSSTEVYTSDFSANNDLWSPENGSSITRGGGGTHITIYNGSPSVARRYFFDLDEGKEYTLTANVSSYGDNDPWAAHFEVSDIGSSDPITTDNNSAVYTELSYTFVATSDFHTIRLVTDTLADTNWKNITLVVSNDIHLQVSSAEATLDETRAPYCTIELVCSMPNEEALELIDPRLSTRVFVTAEQSWIQPVRDPQTRTFDLLLHERSIGHGDAELRLQLVSDEATIIDAGNDTTSPTRIYGLSVKDAVDATLAGHGFALEAGAVDATLEANPPTLPVITNLLVNPSAETNTTNAAASSCTLARSATWANSGAYSFQLNGPTDIDSYFTIGGDMGGMRNGMLAGHTYVASGTLHIPSMLTGAEHPTRARGITIHAYNGTSYTILESPQQPNEPGTYRVSKKFTVPVDSIHAFVRFYHGHTAGTVYWDDLRLSEYVEGADMETYFDGSTLDTGLDTYAWTGTAHASASTRTNLLNSDVFIQTPGTLDWDYVAPLVQAGGLRLFCDEQRKWRLVNPLTYTVPGQINVSAGTNATSGKDTISRQQEAWFDAVVVEYRWTDAEGLPQVGYDAASNGGTKLLRKVIERPYPGAGAAASILALYSGRGRTLDVEALTDLDTTPGMALVMTMPGTPIQVGVVSSVTWKWSAEGDSDEMRVGSRGLLDTPETAWLLQPTGYKWQDVPLGQSWAEYTTPI